ncbi:hypothetical protein LguiA_021597 [Lonicera macranthoides]
MIKLPLIEHNYSFGEVPNIEAEAKAFIRSLKRCKLQGRSFTTLRLIVDDSTILDILKDVHISGGIEIYSEHDFETNIEDGFGKDEKQGNAIECSESSDGDSKDNNSDGDLDSDCYSAPSVKNMSDE